MEDLLTLQFQLCFSSLKTFNISCKDVYSNEVFKTVQPFVDKVKDYIFSPREIAKQNDLPLEMDAQLVNFLFNFWLAPETNLLIERNFDMNHEENEVFDADNTVVEDIQRLLERAESYREDQTMVELGQNFMMTGVLPYIYKYANILYNLTKFEVKVRGVNPYV